MNYLIIVLGVIISYVALLGIQNYAQLFDIQSFMQPSSSSRVQILEKQLLLILDEYASMYWADESERKNEGKAIIDKFQGVFAKYGEEIRRKSVPIALGLVENDIITGDNQCLKHDTLLHVALKLAYEMQSSITKQLLQAKLTTSVTPEYMRLCCEDMYALTSIIIDSSVFDLTGRTNERTDDSRKDTRNSDSILLPPERCDAMTPLQLATLYRQHSVMQQLMDGIKKQYGSKSSDSSNTAVCKEIAYGGLSTFSMSPVHLAIINRDLTGVNMLLQACQSQNASKGKNNSQVISKDVYGRTVWQIARMLEYKEIEAVLTQYYGSLTNKNSDIEEDFIHVHASDGNVRDRKMDLDIGGGEWNDARNKIHTYASSMPFKKCGFDVIDVMEIGGPASLSTHLFNKNYLSLQRPVIIRNAMKGWPANKRWKKSDFQKRYGAVDVLAGIIPYGKIFGTSYGYATINEVYNYLSTVDKRHETSHNDKATEFMNFDQFVAHYANKTQEDINYVFDPQILTKELKNDFFFPFFLKGWQTLQKGFQFIWGPEASGAPIHLHCDAFNMLIYGHKKWYMVPPDLSFYSNVHPVQWLSKHLEVVVNKNKKPELTGKVRGPIPVNFGVGSEIDGAEVESKDVYECVQEGGEIFYVPRFWGHATVNTRETIGMAIEYNRGDC